MEQFSTDFAVLLVGIFLLCGVMMTKLSARVGVPALILFMF